MPKRLIALPLSITLRPMSHSGVGASTSKGRDDDRLLRYARNAPAEACSEASERGVNLGADLVGEGAQFVLGHTVNASLS